MSSLTLSIPYPVSDRCDTTDVTVILQLLACRAADSISFSVPDRNVMWNRAEDDLLEQAVAKYSTPNVLGRDWIEVALELSGRLPLQCQERYRLAHTVVQLTFVFLPCYVS